VEANSAGGQGSRRAVALSDDNYYLCLHFRETRQTIKDHTVQFSTSGPSSSVPLPFYVFIQLSCECLYYIFS
jgi:hypothetical protein